MKKKRAIVIGGILLGLCLLLAVVAFLFWNGILLFNHPSSEQYPVRGVDVSSYQGEIDWDTLASQDLSFAFIKATEGSSFVDPYFEYNYAQSQKTRLRVGAYHFFSFDSAGEMQADHFIQTVEKIDGMLPPVVDFEFYGDKEKNPPEPEKVREELTILLQMLEAHYGMKPILYATEKSYSMYLAGEYDAYDIWIRNVVTTPTLSDGRRWTFWQYTNRQRLEGYRGKERFIDMNVFNGTWEEFNHYAT